MGLTATPSSKVDGSGRFERWLVDNPRRRSERLTTEDLFGTRKIRHRLRTLATRYPVADDAPPDEVLRAYASRSNSENQRRLHDRRRHRRQPNDTRASMTCSRNSSRTLARRRCRCASSSQATACFHIHSKTGQVLTTVSAGDLIRVPRGTLHWFNLCSDRRIRAIRRLRHNRLDATLH